MSRPSMFHVIAMLNGDLDIGTLLSKPLYLMFWQVDGSSRATHSNDTEFHLKEFDSSQGISVCSYSQCMPLQHTGQIN